MLQQIGFGGGCHWCTEAVFQHLKGVAKVHQGWIAAKDNPDFFSEAVLVHYDEDIIPLAVLVKAHLITHSSTSQHAMREKYRSAVYVFDDCQKRKAHDCLQQLQPEFDQPLVTQTMDFGAFKSNTDFFTNYYLNKPEAPFCERHIQPKLFLLQRSLGSYFKEPLDSYE
ncbi:peptide methionine sulfoxide reductase [Echinicola strongylocentroti]|uniref:peptide-methionine (S)-S-oxide reductase n=1 Tax=Echinicola strongylocentroti TaxID=1795355 RepID=A0A2Z4IS78_9BACT|nr:peptide-methionine (S)-S-oxide reductase [Echinicola strongylocentroti]AWW33163.1 peptide methionine sulfoxide reductase [Echinicola strongylocentroti]